MNLKQAEWSHILGMHVILKVHSGLCIQRGYTDSTAGMSSKQASNICEDTCY